MLHVNRTWTLATLAGAERFAIPHAAPASYRQSRTLELREHPERLLAYLLTEHSWTLCQGWVLGPYAFVNDSTSPDGAQEWAIVRLSDGVQLESVTFGWMSREEAEAYLARVMDGELEEGDFTMGTVDRAQLVTPERAHDCAHCR